MVLCGVCDKWQHAVCFSILKQEDAPQFHICVDCAKVITYYERKIMLLQWILLPCAPEKYWHLFLFLLRRMDTVVNVRTLHWWTLKLSPCRYKTFEEWNFVSAWSTSPLMPTPLKNPKKPTLLNFNSIRNARNV